IYSELLREAALGISNFSSIGLNDITMFSFLKLSLIISLALVTAYSEVKRCCPSTINKSGVFCFPLAPIDLLELDNPFSQNKKYPTGYPLYIESNRSLTFVSFQTNGRCISGNPIVPISI